jgi:hypothetical protein
MSRRVAWPAGILLAAWIALVFLAGWAEARVFSGIPVDGPFQLLNALRRLHAGQHAGTDFPFFHGVGVPWLHYPGFAFLGADLWASELTRQWLSPLLYLLSMSAFGWVSFGDVRKTVVFVALGVLLSYPLGLRELYTPGNSLLGIRSTMPVFLFTVLLTRWNGLLKAVVGGVLAALAWICGTDQGLMLLAACGAMGLFLSISRRPWGKTIAGIFGVGVLALVPLLMLITGPNVKPALHYAFVDLPADQFWFFGAPPNVFPADIRALRFIGFRAIAIIGISIAVWLVLVLRPSQRPNATVVLLMLTAGLLSCLSYLGLLSASYFAPLGRLLLLGTLMWALSASHPGWLILLSIPAVLLGLAGPATDLWKRREKLWESGPVVSGCILTPEWNQHLKEIEKVVGPLGGRGNALPLWSTYRGLPEAVAGAILPGEDYMIHALGPARAAYVERFRQTKPEYVLTIRTDYTDYEEWLRNSTWPFYREVLDHYEIAGETPFALLWKRTVEAIPADSPVQAMPAGEVVNLPATVGEPDVVTVEVEYRTSSWLRRVPLFKSLPRYLIQMRGTLNRVPVSLPPAPEGGRFEFGLLRRPGRVPILKAEAEGLVPGASIEIREIRIQPRQLTPGQMQFARAGAH